jgi:hypothetical protein
LDVDGVVETLSGSGEGNKRAIESMEHLKIGAITQTIFPKTQRHPIPIPDTKTSPLINCFKQTIAAKTNDSDIASLLFSRQLIF